MTADNEAMTPQGRSVEAPAFDDLAAAYDAAFTASALGRSLRALTWERLDAALGSSRRVLEIGCGTGEDARRLALRGVDVLATDPSPSMLRLAAEKAAKAGCAKRIEFRCVPMERLGAELAGERFDGVWSNFGAINCIPKLGAVVAELAALLAPGAPLAWVVMGRHVPWEWAWFLSRGNPRKAFRRQRRGGAVWRGMRIVYPTPRELTRTLAPHFTPTRCRPLGCVLPPSYASGWLERRPRVLGALARVERAAQRFAPLAALADHYIFEARLSRARDG
ncbi:MAG TPA: class I SAM-dependent methyltransferase [Gammaproteobacteria bacterium]|nr:class I SAM-dependent methyltransferase [Gammaproteobacteria bacterium]